MKIYRVLFYLPNLAGGGAERVLINVLDALPRDQFEPILVVHKLEGPHTSKLAPDLNVVELGCRSLWTSTPSLVSCVKRLNPDIFVAVTGGAGIPLVLSHLITASSKRLLIWERSVIAGSWTDWKHSLMIFIKRILWKRAALVNCVGNEVAKDVIELLRLEEHKVISLPSPMLDERYYRYLRESPPASLFSDESPVVLCVARLVDAKDHKTLLHAFAKLRATRDVKLVLLGDGNLREDLEILAENLGIKKSVFFEGFVENPVAYMARSDMMVLTSRHEGIPGVVVQAMAAGTPVVATDAKGGTSELVRNGSTGWLVPVGDDAALFSAMCAVLDNPDICATYAQSAKSSVAKYNVDVAMRGYIDALVP